MTVSRRRIEMFPYRQVLVRLRAGDSYRAPRATPAASKSCAVANGEKPSHP
jgi:hypothetical protein